MTALDLAVIKARAEAATPGPWESRSGTVFVFPRVVARHVLRHGNSADEVISDGPHGQADAEFIAHARTDIPALLAEIERLRAAAESALPVVAYVSGGRGYLSVEPYPDASARRVNALLRDALDAES